MKTTAHKRQDCDKPIGFWKKLQRRVALSSETEPGPARDDKVMGCCHKLDDPLKRKREIDAERG